MTSRRFVVIFALISAIVCSPTHAQERSTAAIDEAVAAPSRIEYNYTPPESEWQAAAARRALSALARQEVDVLVVPFQVDGFALDNTARSLMTLSLSQGIENSARLKVADSGLVEQAFTGGTREISQESIAAVAKATSPGIIVMGFVGHDQAGHFHLRVQKLKANDGIPDWSSIETVKFYESIPFNEASLPYFGFREKKSEIISSLAEESTSLTFEPDNSERSTWDLPESIGDIEKAMTRSPIAAAYYLQSLASLFSAHAYSRARDRLYERSLVLAETFGKNTKDYQLISARALAWLNRRPAAIRILGRANSAESKSILALLDGHVRRMEDAISDVEMPIFRFLSTMDLIRLQQSYRSDPESRIVEELLERYPNWAANIYQAFQSQNPWAGFSPAATKVALDIHFPTPEYDFETFAAAKMSIGDAPTDYEITQLAIDHIASAEKVNTQGQFSIVAQWVLSLSREHLVGSSAGRIEHIHRRIGRPKPAVASAKEFEPLFSGHPSFVIAMAKAQRDLSNHRTGTAKEYLLNESYENLRRGAVWQSAQSEESKSILVSTTHYFPGSESLNEAERARMFFESDWPSLPGWRWNAVQLDAREDILTDCVNYTITNLQCVRELHASLSNPESKRWLTKEVASRFVGHPDRTLFLSDIHRNDGDFAAANAVLQQAIDAGTNEWEPYNRLATSMAKQGQAEDAARLILRYPEFTSSQPTNSVELSNRSYEIGSLLFWAGAYEQAQPLYELATSYGTGSSSDMASRVRLALLKGDYAVAVEETVNRVRRYRSHFAYRDLIALLTLVGDLDTASDVLDGVGEKLDNPEVWHGALVLQRAKNLPLKDIEAWAQTDSRSMYVDQNGLFADRHVFMAGLIDRKPDETLAKHFPFESEVVSQGTATSDTGESRKYPFRERRVLAVLSKAMAAFYNKDYKEAQQAFEDVIDLDLLTEFLPYYAWASSKSGQDTKILARLEYWSARKERSDRTTYKNTGAFFEYLLARAYVAGAAGNINDALQYLKRANGDVAHTRGRMIFTRYQIIEAAELLYEDTNDQRYREFALDLARRNTINEPTNSWAYAFLAKFTNDSAERDFAAARALYLDPQSYRVNQLPKKVVKRAKERAAKGLPLAQSKT